MSEDKAKTTFTDKAIPLVRMGFKVFPGRGKIPAKKGPWNASVAKGQMREWGTEDPSYTPLIDCSDRAGDHLAVIDIDMKDGVDGNQTLIELAEQGFELPETLSQLTPSGGRHLIFKVAQPVPNSVRKLGPGLDTRSKGGYIAFYGHFDIKPIAELPGWVIETLGKNENKLELVPTPAVESDQDAALARAVIFLKDSAELAVEGNGGDATTYNVACLMKDMGLEPKHAFEAMLEHWNDRCTPPWGIEELAAKVSNAFRYGKDTAGSNSPEAIFDDDLPQEETVQPKKKSRLYFEMGDQLNPNTANPYLVKGMMGQGSLVQIYGPPNSGKTTVAADFAFHMAYGLKSWQGKKINPGPVLYLSTESPESIRRRKRAFEKEYKLEGKSCAFGLVPCSIDLMEAKTAKEIVDLIKQFEVAVGRPTSAVVVDTLARAMHGDENSAKDMGLAIRAFDLIREYTKAAVILVHHSGKDSTKGARGSSALKGAIDSEFEIRPGVIRTRKQRDMEIGVDMPFALKAVTLGQDQDGDPVTACVLSRDDTVFDLDPAEDRSPQANEVLEHIQVLADMEDLLVPREGGFPAKRIELKVLREGLKKDHVSLYRNINRLLGTLEVSGAISVQDNWIFVT